MPPWWQIFRPANLLIAAATQYLLYYKLVIPSLEQTSIAPPLGPLSFALLVAMTIAATAAGYLINDWYDHPIDKINKPQKVIVHQRLSGKSVIALYLSLLLAGGLMTGYLTNQLQDAGILGLYLFVNVLLYFYARNLKKTILWGNFAVALLCGLVAGLVWYVSRHALVDLNDFDRIATTLIEQLFIAYLFFAFVTTLFREIIKDIEDVEGDRYGGANTLPIARGLAVAKKWATATGIILLGGLVFWGIGYAHLYNNTATIWLIFLLALPFAVVLWKLRLAHSKAEFHRISQLTKAIMVAGLLYLFLLL